MLHLTLKLPLFCLNVGNVSFVKNWDSSSGVSKSISEHLSPCALPSAKANVSLWDVPLTLPLGLYRTPRGLGKYNGWWIATFHARVRKHSGQLTVTAPNSYLGDAWLQMSSHLLEMLPSPRRLVILIGFCVAVISRTAGVIWAGSIVEQW